MVKKIFLSIALLFSVLLLFGCIQQQPSGPSSSGLEGKDSELENSLNASDSELDNALNEIPNADFNPEELEVLEESGLESDESLLSQDQTLADSLSFDFSDFSEIDSLNAINPADLQ